MRDLSDHFHTSDGVEITPNLRVFGYDGHWGNVEPTQFTKPENGYPYYNYNHPKSEHFDGWYTVVWDNGSTNIANGTRMAHKTPLSIDPNPDKVIPTNGNES